MSAVRVSLTVVALCMSSLRLVAQGPSADASLQEQLTALAAALRDTKAELQQTREDIKQLRTDLARVTKPAAAQQPAYSGGQLDERVSTLEERQEVVDQRLAEQYQSKVESASRYRVKLSGMVLFNAYGNSAAVENSDFPTLALPPGNLQTRGDFGATIRQTEFTLQLNGPRVAGARTSADATFDFAGGFPNTTEGSIMGLVRLKLARVRFDWGHTSIVAGQDSPFFSPLSPTSFASVAVPALAYSGNLWTWTPQVRVEHTWAVVDNSAIGVTGGILDPLSGEIPVSQFDRQPEAGERSRQPAVAARAWYSHTVSGRRFVFGAGSYESQQNYGFGRTVRAWAATADWTVPATSWLEWSGEFFRGRALGGLWGSIDTSVISNGVLTDAATQVRGLNTMGGWSQVKVRATPKLEFNGAFGQVNPFAGDIFRFRPTGTDVIARNQTVMLNAIHHPRSNLLLSLEYRRINTAHSTLERRTADHVNAAVGVLF